LFISPKRLEAKADEPIFVYVIRQIINKKYIVACRPTMINEDGGLSSTRKGKGRGMRG